MMQLLKYFLQDNIEYLPSSHILGFIYIYILSPTIGNYKPINTHQYLFSIIKKILVTWELKSLLHVNLSLDNYNSEFFHRSSKELE